MGILIDNRQKIYPLPLKRIQQKAQTVLDALGSPDGELSLLLVDDSQIAVLNKQYLNRSGPTNVIAFPMRSGKFVEISPQLLGDVAISLETAKRESTKAGISLNTRFDQLLIHGILHIFGYDHENDDHEARKMAAKARELMQLIETI